MSSYEIETKEITLLVLWFAMIYYLLVHLTPSENEIIQEFNGYHLHDAPYVIMYHNPIIWSSKNSPAEPKFRNESALRADKFTILLGTYSTGADRLIALIYQFKILEDIIHEIHLNWKDPDPIRYELVKTFFKQQADIGNFSIPLHIFTSGEEQEMFLNHRWASFPHVETLLIYTIDDDMLIKHRGVRTAFQTAQHYTNYIVGWGIPFKVGKLNNYITTWPGCRMTSPHMLTLGGGTFVSLSNMQLYFSKNETITALREIVDIRTNSEDILMNWIIEYNLRQKNLTELSLGTNIYVFPKQNCIYQSWPPKSEKVYGTKAKGLSTGRMHQEDRRVFVKDLLDNFGFKPERHGHPALSWDYENCPLAETGGCRNVGEAEHRMHMGESFDEFISWFPFLEKTFKPMITTTTTKGPVLE